MITIAHHPMKTEFFVNRLWNGELCSDERLWARAFLSQEKDGLRFSVTSPMLHEQSVPDAPMGSRVDGLWKHDVVELFLVGPGHRYLEIELGAGGHFLALGFESIRRRSQAYETFEPVVRFEKTTDKHWTSSVLIPWKMIPDNVRALNVFAILSGQFLALSPVPGEKPDYHQPDFFPHAQL